MERYGFHIIISIQASDANTRTGGRVVDRLIVKKPLQKEYDFLTVITGSPKLLLYCHTTMNELSIVPPYVHVPLYVKLCVCIKHLELI